MTQYKREDKNLTGFCGWLDPVIANLYKVIVVKDAVACFFSDCANVICWSFVISKASL